jgi:hypothetical protein
MHDKNYNSVEIGDVVIFEDSIAHPVKPIIRIGQIFDFRDEYGTGNEIFINKITGLNVYRRVGSKEITKLNDEQAMLWKLEHS